MGQLLERWFNFSLWFLIGVLYYILLIYYMYYKIVTYAKLHLHMLWIIWRIFKCNFVLHESFRKQHKHKKTIHKIRQQGVSGRWVAQTIEGEETSGREGSLLNGTIRRGFAHGLGLELRAYDSEMKEEEKNTSRKTWQRPRDSTQGGCLRDTGQKQCSWNWGRIWSSGFMQECIQNRGWGAKLTRRTRRRSWMIWSLILTYMIGGLVHW